MTSESLTRYAPCPRHRLWFDQTQECFDCLCERAESAPLPEVGSEKAEISRQDAPQTTIGMRVDP
jgi:hypothetical protein